MAFMGGTPVGAPVVGWMGENLGAPVGLIAGGAIVAVAAAALGLIGIRSRGLRLQARVFPRPRVRLGPDRERSGALTVHPQSS
jgi:hypothetical protein